MTDSSSTSYKGFNKEKINTIQKNNMPRISIPIVDIQELAEKEQLPKLHSALEIIATREAKNTDTYVLCEMAKMYLDSFSSDDLSNEIKLKAEIIAKILSDGNSAEIKKNRDGLLILEIKRKVVKR